MEAMYAVFAVAFGEPPAVIGRNHAFFQTDVELGLLLARTVLVLDDNPVAIGDAVLGCILGIDRNFRFGMNGAQMGDLTPLRVEETPLTSAGSERERILLNQVGPAHRTLGRLFVEGERAHAHRFEIDAIELIAACRRRETRLTIVADLASLIAVVPHLGVSPRAGFELIPCEA